MHKAWADLIEGLTLLSKGEVNDISPLHCEHDTLTVCSDPESFTEEEIAHLSELGFDADEEGCFTSYRFGSA
jgi:hypothetical protein